MSDLPGDPAATDAALMARYAAGDAGAAQALAGRLAPRLYRFALRALAGDAAEAEDVVQETMLRLWRAAPGWRAEGAQVATWAFRVAANLCTDRLRRRRLRDGPPPPEDLPDGQPGVEARMTATARLAALQAALDALPDRQRQAVLLRHFEGLANPEIAAIMEVGVEAVESLVARGKRGLAAALAGQRAALGFAGED
jgi:RNA polymerase sigma-70 factor (ECF subfamily)